MTSVRGTLHEDLRKFTLISTSILFRKRNVSDKNCRQSQNAHFMLNGFFSLSLENPVFYVDKYDTAREVTGDNIILHMRIAFCITKATDTHSEYVIILSAFPLQEWLHECASIVRYMCILLRK